MFFLEISLYWYIRDSYILIILKFILILKVDEKIMKNGFFDYRGIFMYNTYIAILDHGSSRACAMGACESCQD